MAWILDHSFSTKSGTLLFETTNNKFEVHSNYFDNQLDTFDSELLKAKDV